MSKYLKKVVFPFFLIFGFSAKAVEIKEGIYEGTPHFIVYTSFATYYYDQLGGGISRMIDKEGNDWIAFKKESWNKVPESAASAFRGMPNAVYKGDDGGAGHPGFEQCKSSILNQNTIRSIAKSGLWEWVWEFHEDHAVWKVLKTDPSRKYWFLYEGPVGGSFQPNKSFWGNNVGGPLYDVPELLKGQSVTGNWEWVYFGSETSRATLFIVHVTNDKQQDFFSYMGNSPKGNDSQDGMVVFGLGRSNDTKPLLSGNHQVVIGFWNDQVSSQSKHKRLEKYIKKYLNKREFDIKIR